VNLDRLERAPHMQCAVCGEVLAPLEPGVPWLPITYLHTKLNVDHEPVPAPLLGPQKLTCDFCCEAVTEVYTLRSEPFSRAARDHEWAGYVDDGQWACCKACLDLIRAGDWELVAQRAERSLIPDALAAGLPRAAAAAGIRDMHQSFRDTWNGAIPEEPHEPS
jgi:hypothetical protein